jgi:KEOPS complex subunit Pcc1
MVNEIQDTNISNIDIHFEIETADIEICNQLYANLQMETDFDPNERSTVEIRKLGSTLILKINAKDAVSARATVNSYLKWIDLSFQLIDSIKRKS